MGVDVEVPEPDVFKKSDKPVETAGIGSFLDTSQSSMAAPGTVLQSAVVQGSEHQQQLEQHKRDLVDVQERMTEQEKVEESETPEPSETERATRQAERKSRDETGNKLFPEDTSIPDDDTDEGIAQQPHPCRRDRGSLEIVAKSRKRGYEEEDEDRDRKRAKLGETHGADDDEALNGSA